MNTLREILEFVGLSGPKKFVPALGNTGFTDPTMRTVGLQVQTFAETTVLTNEQKSSMRAMILGLQNFPPISLKAEAENIAGEVPFRSVLHLSSSTGVVLETSVGLFRSGQLVGTMGHIPGPSATDVAFDVVDPGSYVIEVRRTGIPGTGITVLTKSFPVEGRPKAGPPPPPLEPPKIEVEFSGSIQKAKFHVTGSKFLKNRPPNNQPINQGIAIRFVDANSLKETRREFTKSSSEGNIDHVIEGDLSGLTRNALGIATAAISATDGRPDPSDITGFLFSNTVRIDFQ